MLTSEPNAYFTWLTRRRGEIGLLVLCLFLFFWRLGDARLFDLDEGLYVSCARNMAVTGDFITPYLNSRPHDRPGQLLAPFFEKPIMVYWLSASMLRIFGVSEEAARLPAAFASLFATAIVVWAGRRWFGNRAGLLSGLVYATVPMTVLDARQMTTDALLTLWFLLAMLGYLERKPVLFWVACAFAVLTKGIVGLLLPGLVLAAFHLTLRYLTQRGRRTFPPLRSPGRGQRSGHAAGLALFLLITVPWHVAIWKAGGQDLNERNWVQEYIIMQHVGRFKGVDKHHNAPPPTYIAYFLIGFFPWACFAPVAFRNRPDEDVQSKVAPGTKDMLHSGAPNIEPGGAARSNTEVRSGPVEERPPASTIHLFLLCWFWTIFLFFSASAAKLPTYIVPVYPAAALLVGKWLDKKLSQEDRSRPGTGLASGAFAATITALLLLATILLLPVVTHGRPVMPPEAARLALFATLLVTSGCLIGWLCLLRARNIAWLRAGIGTLAVTMTLLIGLIAGPGYAVANRWIFGPYQNLAILARADAAKGLPVVYYHFGDRRPSMLYYARDYSPLERKETPLLPFLKRYLSPNHPGADIITLESTYNEQLRPELEAAGWRAEIVGSQDSSIAEWVLLRIAPGDDRPAAR